jgi:hypothetical protein
MLTGIAAMIIAAATMFAYIANNSSPLPEVNNECEYEEYLTSIENN